MFKHEHVVGTGNVIVVVRSDIAAEWEEEFNRWYNEVHIPELLALPGYLYARRFIAESSVPEGEPRYVAVYELEDGAVLEGEAYRQLRNGEETRRWVQRFTKFSRQVYREVHAVQREGAQGTGHTIVLGRNDVAVELEEEYNQWYNHEHLPALLSIPGYLHARRFFDPETSPGSQPRYVTLYELEDASGLHGEVREKARAKDTRAASFIGRFTGFTRQACREIFDSRR